jgi:hypothetical protein
MARFKSDIEKGYFGRLLAQEFIKVCRAGILPRLSLDQLERIA